MTDRTLPGRSMLLYSPKFDGQIDQHVPRDEEILDSADGKVEVFDTGRMKPHHDTAVMLTSRRLLAFRGRGLMGAKKPLVIELSWVDEVGVTRQGNVTVKFTGEYGLMGLWKLYIAGDDSEADRWARQIQHAAQSPG